MGFPAAEGSPEWGGGGALHEALLMLRRCHPLPARLRGPTSPLQGEVKSLARNRR
jgi:hypothetical protein